jgi:fatty acid desaturase
VQDLSDAPPFTLADLRSAIPAECWERSTARSFAYLFKDVAIVAGLAAGAYALNSWYGPSLIFFAATPHAALQIIVACLLHAEPSTGLHAGSFGLSTGWLKAQCSGPFLW